MSNINIQVARTTIKCMIKILLEDYSKDFKIENRNSFNVVLASICWKSTADCAFYTPKLVYALLAFLESKLIRGILFPENIIELTLELVEILDNTYYHPVCI